MKPETITKSQFVAGERCAKLQYLSCNAPGLRAPVSSLEQKTLAVGQLVTAAARERFPNGILISSLDPEQALKETQQAIDAGALTIYEPAFCYDNILVRVDILSRPTSSTPWNFHEVKATTYSNISKEQEQEYQNDIAIQIWVLRNHNIELAEVYLTHLNSDCRHPDLYNLFFDVDYSEAIAPMLQKIGDHLAKQRAVLTLVSAPEISIGRQCEKPRPCPFSKHCWRAIPSPSIFDIPACRKKWEFFNAVRLTIDSLSIGDFRSEIHQRILVCCQEEHPYFDADLISQELDSWVYPLVYLDFESIDPPIPCFPETRPFQHLPFQFSCHIQGKAHAPLAHKEFLFDGSDDPRPAFIEALLEAVPQQGSIVVYYAPYESTRLKELARDFPQYTDGLLAIRSRLVDLMEVIKKGVYYPEFLGSFSIKKVAQVLFG